MPQIIDEDLFNQVAERMQVNLKAPARARAKAEYLLTTKLFCGYCKAMMVGHSSNQVSKRGIIFNYYKCKNQGGGKPCKKKMVHKDTIEDRVVDECRKPLTPQDIRRIAKELVKIVESLTSPFTMRGIRHEGTGGRPCISRFAACLHEIVQRGKLGLEKFTLP